MKVPFSVLRPRHSESHDPQPRLSPRQTLPRCRPRPRDGGVRGDFRLDRGLGIPLYPRP